MPAKNGTRSGFSGLARISIAPTCATASVSIVGGTTASPFGVRERYHSSSVTFLIPTIRLSGSSSMMRSTSRNGNRWGRIRSIAALSSGSVRSIAANRLYFGRDRRHRGPRGSSEHDRSTGGPLRPGPRSRVGSRSRRAAPENPPAHLAADEVHRLRDVPARSEAQRADGRLFGGLPRGGLADVAVAGWQRPGRGGGRRRTADPRQQRPRRSAVLRGGSRLAGRARGAAAAQGPRDWRAQPAQRYAG